MNKYINYSNDNNVNNVRKWRWSLNVYACLILETNNVTIIITI